MSAEDVKAASRKVNCPRCHRLMLSIAPWSRCRGCQCATGFSDFEEGMVIASDNGCQVNSLCRCFFETTGGIILGYANVEHSSFFVAVQR